MNDFGKDYKIKRYSHEEVIQDKKETEKKIKKLRNKLEKITDTYDAVNFAIKLIREIPCEYDYNPVKFSSKNGKPTQYEKIPIKRFNNDLRINRGESVEIFYSSLTELFVSEKVYKTLTELVWREGVKTSVALIKTPYGDHILTAGNGGQRLIEPLVLEIKKSNRKKKIGAFFD